MKVRCAVVEDEPLAQRLIRDHIDKVADLELAGSFSNAIDAAAFLRSHVVDLLFLDIQMPEITGLQLIKSLKNPPEVIFTTAFRTYATDAFDLDAIDYLLKPISFERFLKAVHKYYDRVSSASAQRSLQPESTESTLFIKSERKTVRIPTDEIKFIESLDDYVKVHGREKTWITREKIGSLEKTLSSHFVRIHRSYLINKQFVTAFSGESVYIDKLELPFGRAFKRIALTELSQTNG